MEPGIAETYAVGAIDCGGNGESLDYPISAFPHQSRKCFLQKQRNSHCGRDDQAR